ncbi:1-(5-phosphoribosyl)-5-[(5-phosphoribosylamino)methylideneamino]imidazole-4-carboxamide isomerase [Helicobacter sp. 11S03491-1]|uniref:1-(5-phosphoribosyl)-5-[(5- phosphoribosylamino)methylideneamino]imidazole-4- carboxamide isomerase n=1 Tax=Helicobacter sp. 11S03491-1 TaxID=1476196 RepID=UPI000BA7610A|nr:1-(5-phosphoribosyl)-5-[(5-phosphoribosylamino)methylideneamino]imidazole-4-carboxamide isomerase [Helicobacter sp. 11S03491-1]PAF43305.1 1-(5-phosphoribosyl)-5-[(5-phosphoribosylamino)methylideneamino]imidazole-4-carboxamide isomerase [Helicobacter sp. 11S03491-1]
MLEIFPAIDLKDGQAVRLHQGDMASAKIYGNAKEFARKFQDMGSKWVHVVDLNGAFCGEPKNLKEIEAIRKSCNLKIQLGGGIRDEKTIKRYVDMGIDRLVLGSVAMKNPSFVKEMAVSYKIAVGIDAKKGMVATEGWAQTSEMQALDLAREFKSTSIDALICTDIGRDGCLNGLNIDLTLQIAKVSDHFCIASGGLKDEKDVLELEKEFKRQNIKGGVIIGKAYYEGRVDLESILKRFA